MNLTPPQFRDFISVGCLSAQLQKPVREIEQAAAALDMSPAMRLNGIPHFDAEQVEKLVTAIHSLPAAGIR